ncbi:MAG: BlaI/MecI/CopY family transcriptional regulator [Candidatus Aminicenantes bacterium]|jgi:predicted transcriptional regulator|nr:BlaI/MecI/CopY family transcriptional regulator [Candidatus Aminicenantes bacterium]
MTKNGRPRPTEAELGILQVLWKNGPCTVRFVNDKLNDKKEVGYTTTLKIMQIMFNKNILERDESKRSHLYNPAVKETETQSLLLDKFLQTAFAGSAMKLVMQALGNHKASKEEISRIREFLDNLESKGD